MLKSHKKLHHKMAKGRGDGQKPHCCTSVFVGNPEWGAEPERTALPVRWVRGIRTRPVPGSQR
jgi:hypothetical protein